MVIIASVFRPFAVRRHFHELGIELTENGHQIVLGGHYLVAPIIHGDAGSALVYAGTGLAGRLRVRGALLAGCAAGFGALVRGVEPASGHALILVGSGLLGILLLRPLLGPRRA